MLVQPTLVILAAGMGSRYGGIKQIEGVGPNKESLIDYSIYNALRVGYKKIVMVIRKDIEKEVKNFFKGKIPAHIPVEWVFQELHMIPKQFSVPPHRAKPWGTGHALLLCKDVVHEPFAMINGDDYYAYEALKAIFDFLLSHDPETPTYAIAGYELQRTLSPYGAVSRGICRVDDNGNLISLEENKAIHRDKNTKKIISEHPTFPEEVELTGKEPASMNLFGFNTIFLHQLEKGFLEFLPNGIKDDTSEFFVPSYLGELVMNNKAQVKVLRTHALWFGITYKEDAVVVKEHINSLIDNDIYPKSLWT